MLGDSGASAGEAIKVGASLDDVAPKANRSTIAAPSRGSAKYSLWTDYLAASYDGTRIEGVTAAEATESPVPAPEKAGSHAC
jgi:hypothetical protein